MNALQQFLTEHDVSDLTQEFKLGGRLKDFTLKVKAITSDQYTDFQNQCVDNPNNPKKRRFNTKKFNELVLIAGLVEPNLRDVEFLNANGCSGNPSRLLYKVFLPGEINEISEQILNLSGFGNEVEEDIEEIKNSSTGETVTPGTVITQ